MHNENPAEPKSESEQTTPCSSRTEPPNLLKYRKVMSERQLQANRANAARSKGRKSREGIQRSAQNARKHGLRAADVRGDDPACGLAPDEQTEFVAFATELLKDLAPRNPGQLSLARQIVAGFWTLNRLLAFEREAIHNARSTATPDCRAEIVLPAGDDFERLMLYRSRLTGRLDRAIEQFLLEREKDASADERRAMGATAL